MPSLEVGSIYRIKDKASIKNRDVVNASKRKFIGFLILEKRANGKITATGVYEHNKSNYCILIRQEEEDFWVNCASFLTVKSGYLEPLGISLGDDVVKRVLDEHPKMMEKKEYDAKRRKYLRQQKNTAYKLADKMAKERKPKRGSKKYPYGSGIARRETPSANGIQIVHGGGVSPR